MQPARRYAQLLQSAGSLRDEALRDAWKDAPEVEIQARWFAGEFGTEFRTTRGDALRVVQFGVWNHEAGPDFADAAISLNGGAPLRGSIELDTDARDWERHGHSTNPDYENVALHVFLTRGDAVFFTRTPAHREVPQLHLDLRALAADAPNPQPMAKPGRCAAPLRDLPREKVGAILEAAAQFRLQKKGARLMRLRALHGSDEALFQMLAETLGYKANKLPFTLLAQRLPLRLLFQRREEADALLFGVSGFLGASDLAKFDPQTRGYLRGLWEKWWRCRAEFSRLEIAPALWRMGGQRPANHPHRRVAALARMAAHWPGIRALAHRCDPAEIRRFFAALRDEYWDAHFTLTSRPAAARMALIGEARVADMLANVFFPLALLNDPARWESFRALPAPLSNKRVEIAAVRLFGGDGALKNELLKTAAHQQGLLQIHEDFCQQDNSDCARCPFPRQLGQWR